MVIWKRYPIRAHAFPSAFSTRRKTSLEHILLCMILPVHPFILTFLRPFNRPTNQPINQSTNDLVPHRKARQRSTLPFFTPLPAPRTKLSQDSGRLRLRSQEKEAEVSSNLTDIHCQHWRRALLMSTKALHSNVVCGCEKFLA